MRVLKYGFLVIAILIVFFAGDESVEAGKRRRKNRRGDKHLQKRRHSRNGRKTDDRDAMTWQQNMMAQWQREKSREKSARKADAQIEVEEWREAHIFAHSKNDSKTILHKTVGKVGHHSKSIDIVGKLVHIVDPNMKTHYGCADDIGNKEDIPKKGNWIALIERGKCYFFNKIRMAKLLKASAVIIYNHEEESEVMHTAGTNILALMVGKTDGLKIAELSKQKLHLVVKIKVQDDLHSLFVKDGEDLSIVNPPTARPIGNHTSTASTDFPLDPFDQSFLENLDQEDLDFLRQLGRHNGTGLNPLGNFLEKYGEEDLQTSMRHWRQNGTDSNPFGEVKITTTPSCCVTYKVTWLHLLMGLVCCLLLPTT